MSDDPRERRPMRDARIEEEPRAPKLDRRRFLGGAAGGLALGAAGLVGCQPERPDGPAWDREVDVVLVGTGTGLVGGLVAAASGAEVLALEKRGVVGGSTTGTPGASPGFRTTTRCRPRGSRTRASARSRI